MKYTVHYWRLNLAGITGHDHHSEINEDDLAVLIAEQKVNIMIQHVAETPAKGTAEARPAQSYCYIDDLNHRFQSRTR